MIEVTLKADRRLAAERGRDTHFVLLSFRAPRLERTGDRPGLNLSLVLDRSGSMAGEGKLSLAKQAAELSLARLTAKDRFSLVEYNHEIHVLMPSTLATAEALNDARSAIREMVPGGNTALFDGYLRGAEQVAAHLQPDDLGRVLLLTDGLANVGLVDPDAIVRHVAGLRSRGVQTSTFGVGTDFNHLLLDGMADAGGGNFYFVQSPDQLEDLLTSEVGEALETVAREVCVAVEHGTDIEVRPLDAFASTSDACGLTSRIGSLTSEQLVELLYEVDLPGRRAGERSSIRFAITDLDHALGGAVGVVEFLHASAAEVEAEQPDADIVRRAARRIRLQAGQQAYAMNFVGRRDEVRQEASKALAYLRKLATRDPDVAVMVAELEGDVLRAEKLMSAFEQKVRYYQNSSPLRGRNAAGKAAKNPR
jgi:Ca-activated chloride channel family protein